MRVMEKVLNGVGMGIVLLLVLSFIYYFSDRDYLEGNSYHYIGTSDVTEDQAVSLGTRWIIGGQYSSVSLFEILENGLVKVDYDFYSDESYPYLTVAKFSYYDTRLVNMLLEAKAVILGAIGVCAFATLLFWLGSKSSVITNRKIVNCLWHLLHPKYLIKHPKATGCYSSQIQDSINIDLKDIGILCVRTWKYKGGYLYSAGVGQACWETKTLIANKNPIEKNENGIYVERLGVISRSFEEFKKDIIGIVSLKGEWCEHADGVLRAERCDILHLIVSEYYRSVSLELSSVYGVPVTVADNPINAYLDWLLKDNGFECMTHNSKIMEGNYVN